MARFARIDLQIRANRIDSRESLEGSRIEPLFLRIASPGTNRRFEVIRANRSSAMTIGALCESIRANQFARIAPIRIANRRAL